ncbi:hypothetical protein BKA82DRAFT_4021806 [Pisolithus tinctorius]|nr:hypothetical protein BKA82DRAFT_4021806 [Pisolithus tinctorius]
MPSLCSAFALVDFVPATTLPVRVLFFCVRLASKPLSRPCLALELVGVGPDLTAWGIIDEYTNIWGGAWAEVIKKHRDGNLWCLWAVNDEISRGKWEDLVTQYFQQLASLATIAVQNITLMGTTSDNDKVHARVHAKLEWVHEGYMLQTGHPSSFKTLPIGNKYQQGGLGDRVWQDASWCGPSSEKIIAMIGDFLCQEWPNLLMAQSYLMRNNVDMKSFTLGRLPSYILLDKKFLECVKANIKAYQEQVESWTQSVNFEDHKFDNQRQVAECIINMMHVTAFLTTKFKRTAQLVKALAQIILDKECHEQLLGTTVGIAVMKNSQVSPDLYDAVKRWLELADTLDDVEGMKFSNKMWETHKVRMPPRTDDNTTTSCTSCLGPQEGMGLDLFRKACTFLHGDHEFLEEEMNLEAKEGRQLKKEMSEVEKAHVFQPRGAHMKKLSARAAQINQRKNAQDNDCCVADFDRQMEE